MNIKSVLDQFLASSGITGATENPANGRAFVSGAATGGMMGLLLGSKSGRKFLESAATYGGIAVVGGLAYKALKEWQASKQVGSSRSNGAPQGAIDYSRIPDEFRGQGKSSQLEFALISAMIAAANADGRLDATEQRRIFETLEKSPLSPEERSRIFSSFDSVPSVEQLAGMVTSMEHKAEMYVASCIASNQNDSKVSEYLGRLARALNLPNELTNQLRSNALAA